MALTEDMAFNLMEGAHARSRLAHAFLISGAAGSGKRDLAARVVALVNPVETSDGSDLFENLRSRPVRWILMIWRESL